MAVALRLGVGVWNEDDVACTVFRLGVPNLKKYQSLDSGIELYRQRIDVVFRCKGLRRC